MTLDKKYVGAYSREARDYFSLLPTEQEVIEKLKNIYRNEKGIFILCGNRGAGKSSLKNISLEPAKYYANEDKQILVINISFFSGNKDFYREILMQTPSAIDKRIKEIENRLDAIVNNKQRMYDLPTPVWNEQEEVKDYSLSERYQIEKRISIFYKTIDKVKINCKKNLNLQSLYDPLLKEIQELAEEFESLNKQYESRKSRWVLFKNNRVNVSKFRENIDELDKKIENFERSSIELERLCEFLSISEEQLNSFDVEITDTKKYLESTTSEVSAESSIDLSTDLGIVKLGTQLKGNLGFNESGELSRELKNVVTEELKERQLLRLLKNMSAYFNITFSIDELDKCSTSTVIDMIVKNKRLFFDCNVSTLLITDVSAAISLEEGSDYISESNIIVVPDLTVLDYIYRINSKGMDLSYDFIDILDSYFVNKMNNRELNYSKKYVGEIGFSKGFELYKFINTSFYRNLNQLYQPIVLKFYWELLELLDFVGELSQEEYEQFEDSFFEKYELKSLKVKFIIHKLIRQLVIHSFEYFFIFEDYRSRFRNSKELTEFHNKKMHIADYFEQMALKPTILSDDTAFLKINKLYNFNKELLICLKELGFDDKIFRNILLQLSEPRKRSLSNSMSYRFANKFYNPSRGVSDARDIVKRENTVGVILFYPYDYSEKADPTHQPLRNGIIVTVNDFDEVVLYPYVGYIGLHSHKPSYLQEFKEELENQNIPVYEIEDNDLWEKCFEKDNKELEEKIFEVCKEKIDRWIYELKHL